MRLGTRALESDCTRCVLTVITNHIIFYQPISFVTEKWLSLVNLITYLLAKDWTYFFIRRIRPILFKYIPVLTTGTGSTRIFVN